MLYTTYVFYRDKKNMSDGRICSLCKIDKNVLSGFKQKGYIEDINIDTKLLDILFIPMNRIMKDKKEIQKIKYNMQLNSIAAANST